MTKFLNVLFGGLLTCTLLLTSCSEDASVFDLEDTENFVDDSFAAEFGSDFNSERGGAKCLELVYPVTVVFPDDTSVEVADAEAQKDTIKGWIAANGRDAGKPALEYPVEVITADGETVSVDSRDAMKELLSECKGNRGGKGDGRRGGKPGLGKCLDLVYPVTILFPDGTSVEVADAEAQKDTIRGYIRANGKDGGKPELQFPVDVTNEDGETTTAASADELKELAMACRGDRRTKCFTLVFPVTLTFPDGTTADVNDKSEMKSTLREWKEANPDSEERPELTFPLNVELEDGTTQEVASQEEMDALKESCKG